MLVIRFKEESHAPIFKHHMLWLRSQKGPSRGSLLQREDAVTVKHPIFNEAASNDSRGIRYNTIDFNSEITNRQGMLTAFCFIAESSKELKELPQFFKIFYNK